MSTIEIHPFEPNTTSVSEWTAFHAYRRMRADKDDPGEPVASDAEFEHDACRRWPLHEARHLVRLMDGPAIAALRESHWDACTPDRVFQALTAVARPWRGKGLAKGVKAAMLRLIRVRHPEVRLMITSNAEVNAAMLSINQRLGFAVHRRDGSYQIGPEQLAAWLASREG